MPVKHNFNRKERLILFKECRIYSYVPKNMELWLAETAAAEACSTSSLIYSALLYIKEQRVRLNVNDKIKETDEEMRRNFALKKDAHLA